MVDIGHTVFRSHCLEDKMMESRFFAVGQTPTGNMNIHERYCTTRLDLCTWTTAALFESFKSHQKYRAFVSQWLATVVLSFFLRSYPKYTIDNLIGLRCFKHGQGVTAVDHPGEQATKHRLILPCQIAARVLFPSQEGRPSILHKLVVFHPCRPHQHLAPDSHRFPAVRRCLSSGPRHNGVSSSCLHAGDLNEARVETSRCYHRKAVDKPPKRTITIT